MQRVHFSFVVYGIIMFCVVLDMVFCGYCQLVVGIFPFSWAGTLARGGTKSWILKPQVNFNVTPIYKNWGKRIFEFGVRLNPPPWPSNFENHHYRVKNQSCRKLYRWVSKPIRRKIQNQWKKLELNRAHQLREKSKKPPENTVLKKSDILGGFLDFSLNW